MEYLRSFWFVGVWGTEIFRPISWLCLIAFWEKLPFLTEGQVNYTVIGLTHEEFDSMHLRKTFLLALRTHEHDDLIGNPNLQAGGKACSPFNYFVGCLFPLAAM